MTQPALGARRRSSVLACTGAALVLLAGGALAQTRGPLERDLWYAFVDGDVRYGSQHLEVTELSEGNLRYEFTVRVLIDVLAQRQEIEVDGEFVVTPELRPVSLRVESRQLSGTTVVTGRTNGSTLLLSFERDGTSREKSIELDTPEPVLFLVTVDDWLASLDATTERATARVLDEVTYEPDGVVATRLQTDTGGSRWLLEFARGFGEATLTLDERGVTVESRTLAPRIHLVRCSADEVLDLDYLVVDGSDDLTFPLDRQIVMRDRLEGLVLKLTWKDIPFERFELEDARQRLLERSETPEGGSAVLEITAPRSSEASATLPVEDLTLAPYLAETEFIKPSDPAIQAAAREVIAGETDVGKAVAALSTWVSDFVEGVMIAETLTGPEVLACGKGKCSEYSTLFASMARSVGIPTRIVLGGRLVGEAWMGHMWNEAWVGRWVTVDASVNEIDHSLMLLKLVHGDSIAGVLPLRYSVVENLSVSVEDVRLDLDDEYETGIDDVTYTSVEYAFQLTAPSDDWTLTDKSNSEAAIIEFEVPRGERLGIHIVAFQVPEGTPPKACLDGRAANYKTSFDMFELLESESREIQGANGHVLQFEASNDGDEHAILSTELCWVRGTVGYILTMGTRAPKYEAGQAHFEKLIAGFGFLDE